MTFVRITRRLSVGLAVVACAAAVAPTRAAPPPVAATTERFELAPLQGAAAAFTVEGHRVEVRGDGALALDGVKRELVPPAWKARVIRTAHEHTATTLTMIAEIEIPTTRHDKPVWDLGGAVFARIDLATGQLAWRHRIANYDRDRDWSLIATADQLFVRDRHGLVALDRATGAETWRLDRDYLRSILLSRIYDTMKLEGATLAVTGHYYESEQRIDFAIELDAATGLRVYRKLAYTAPTPRPIYVRPSFRLEYPSDRAPPVQPTEWDGLRIGYAFLAWNVKTGEGIVVNPTRNDARAIIAAAKRQHQVHWLAVYDTRAAIKHSKLEGEAPTLKRHNRPAADANQIALEQAGDIVDSGEIVETRDVAAALGAKVIDRGLETPLATTAGPVLAYHPINNACYGGCPGDELHLSLVWGPYRFVDEYRVSYRSGPL